MGNLTPPCGFEDVSAIEVFDAEESYCNLLMYWVDLFLDRGSLAAYW